MRITYAGRLPRHQVLDDVLREKYGGGFAWLMYENVRTHEAN